MPEAMTREALIARAEELEAEAAAHEHNHRPAPARRCRDEARSLHAMAQSAPHEAPEAVYVPVERQVLDSILARLDALEAARAPFFAPVAGVVPDPPEWDDHATHLAMEAQIRADQHDEDDPALGDNDYGLGTEDDTADPDADGFDAGALVTVPEEEF